MRKILLLLTIAIVTLAAYAQDVPSEMKPYVQLWYKVKIDTYNRPSINNGKIMRYGNLINSETREINIGSGTIVSKTGLILTNYHVYNYQGETSYDDKRNILYVVQPVNKEMVVYELSDNDPLKEPVRKYTAEMLAFDSRLDVTLLKITKDAQTGKPLKNVKFPFVKFGNPFDMKINSVITIIGYPGKGGDTVTITDGKFLGYYKSKDTGSIDGYIKTNAYMAPGNSGGTALFDGYMIGIPTAVSLPSSAGSDFGYVHPITWAAGVLSLAALKFNEDVPEIPYDWMVSDYNTDETKTKILVAGFIETAEAKRPVKNGIVVIKRNDRTIDQIKELDNEITSVKSVYIVQSLYKQGVSIQEIASQYSLTEPKVQKYLRTTINENALSDDAKRYFAGEFFYEVSETDADGFYIMKVPRNGNYDVTAIKDGYRVVEKKIKTKKDIRQQVDKIVLYKY